MKEIVLKDGNVLKVDLAPGELLPADNNPFLMSRSEFLAVQAYVENGTSLPKSAEEMTSKLKISAEDVNEFSDLINVYKSIYAHCYNFKTVVFPMTVTLAANISHYNTKVPVYYGALNPIIAAYNNGSLSEEDATKKLTAILTNLQNTAQVYADDCKTAKENIIQFAEDTKSDKSLLDPLSDRYKKAYEGKGGEIDTLLKEIDNDSKQIKKWQDEYEHDVTVAATTPTYAWIIPLGTIAAGIVAGIYGKKATDALDDIHKYQKKLGSAQEDLRKALVLSNDLRLANGSMDGILEKLQLALPVIEKIEGIWGSLSDDFNNILNVIQRDIKEAEWIIKDLGVQEAIDAWAKAAAIADNYRANAYITVTTEDDIKAEPEKYIIPETA